jgi:predicted TIM-barrel fold metal-dependent hydrolase
MKLRMKVLFLSIVFVLGMVAYGQSQEKQAPPASPSTVMVKAVNGPFTDRELREFTALDPIDTHTHVFRSNPAFYAMLNRLNIHIIDILVVDDQAQSPITKDLSTESKAAWKFVHGSDGRAVLCTSFDPYKLSERGFAAKSIRGINREFSQGAIAVKIWKNIGEEIKDGNGNYILPDNPVFEPIYKDIAAHHKTLIAHVADPNSAWAPPNPDSPDYRYFINSPEWYMYSKPHPASKEQILQARDHILEQNPDLRVVGAHLGSMEDDFHQLAQHLDRYPNFAVDLAARMPYVMMQPRADIIAFIMKYQDRLIYGTDHGFSAGDNVQRTLSEWEESYAQDWRFFATDDTLDYRGHAVQGLALPYPVLRKLYHDNAVQWFPGILHGAH